MKLYRDLFTNDDMISDGYKLELVDEVVFKVKGTYRAKGESDYGIESTEQLDENVEQVIDIVDTFELQEFSFSKKQFGMWAKGYMKKLKTHIEENNPEHLKTFMTNISKFIKGVASEFDEYAFYLGKSMDSEAAVALMRYGSDGLTPYFYYIKDGLYGKKV
ncbi:translationally controlled tumor protein-related [Anaeramoeba flamelloides]|uniref:Translationally controlled tumor protein-related n=1 Tax=Anaeramoeba flamelloides TaxID=1746091 RepID=A0AAV7YR25_9EUKA|nr:translationally controlled tumor protein-related [Anaeramoeba flamelloides]KAJ6250379.1 translationally controlled tumor protein-related [Anaeramoeba flamelloides]